MLVLLEEYDIGYLSALVQIVRREPDPECVALNMLLSFMEEKLNEHHSDKKTSSNS